ncbi:MAG: 3'(2'),5'-bisphosphate nucleotidase [Desulfobacteraceae bacterium IS3]|nr:MAG: 3'(2'),5'-bisphosphate nucleotidase [Desulfobacteraceae bacterium IS3]
MLYEKELKTALAAVRKASLLCRRVQTNILKSQVIEKQDHSPVTVADFGSQAVISLELLAAFPNDAIVGEEDAAILRENSALRLAVSELVKEQISTADASQIPDAIDFCAQDTDFTKRFWTVDPVDGTKGFLRGGQYAVALALAEKGEIVIGVLGCPNFQTQGQNAKGCLFYAVRGQGAFVQTSEGGNTRRISVDAITDPAQARFCESVEEAHSSHQDHQRIAAGLGITAPSVRMDSQAKYAAVACGQASVYLRLPKSRSYREKIWDHAAGAIVITEAGGKVTDFQGKALDFSPGRKLENNAGILASNGHLHEKALQIISDLKL